MANSWNGPQLGSPIRTDVQELQKKLIALLKGDPTSVADIPSGAKRLVNTSGVQWQVQQYNGSSWAAIGKLMHDVDTLDGYHAAITPAANTVAVRNADKKLEGDITGNAATASSATTLSETLPVNKGGTGAATSEAARSNLGVPPTSHASSGTAYGLGSNLNYGHVRGDGKTADVISGEIVVKDVLFNNRISLASSGLLGKARYIGSSASFNIDTDDFDLICINGLNENSLGTYPPFTGFVYIRQYYFSRTSPTNIGNRMQVAFAYSANKMWRRYCLNGEWSAWVKVIDETDLATSSTPGIVKPGTGMTVDSNGALNAKTSSTSEAGIVLLNNTVTSTSTTQAATADAVKTAYDKAVEAHSAVRQVQDEVSTKLENSTIHIIETWKSSDMSSWYRKWSDGFIDQGGTIVTSSYDTDKTCTFATPFSKQKSIRVFCTCDGNFQDGGMWMSVFNPWGITTTSFNIRLKGDLKTTYYACGY